jgi:hypothetical protein
MFCKNIPYKLAKEPSPPTSLPVDWHVCCWRGVEEEEF